MLPNGGEYKTRSLTLLDQITLSWSIVTETTDLMLWNFANSGYSPKDFTIPKECVFPRGFVRLQTPQPNLKFVTSYFARKTD